MLGICRIYSRKVKYLMSDCTEAMWKIKLAFRSGNVDIDISNMNNVNIDDARFFGNYEADNEFATLENAAFPQILLNAYDAPTVEAPLKQPLQQKKTAKSLSTSSSQRWGEDSLDASHYDVSFGFGSAAQPSPSPGPDKNLLGTAAKLRSRVSDVEVMRGEQRPSSLLARHLDDSLPSSRPRNPRASSLSLSALRFEDDLVPAFEAPEADRSRHYDSLGPLEDFLQEAGPGPEEKGLAPPEGPSEEPAPGPEMAIEMAMERPQEEQEEVLQVRPRRALKRPGPSVRDEPVELSGRLIKQRMADLGPILRPRDPCASLAAGIRDRLSLGTGTGLPRDLQDLCPELQLTFRRAMGPDPLPLRLREVDRAPEEPQGHRAQRKESLSIEVARGALLPASDEAPTARLSLDLSAQGLDDFSQPGPSGASRDSSRIFAEPAGWDPVPPADFFEPPPEPFPEGPLDEFKAPEALEAPEAPEPREPSSTKPKAPRPPQPRASNPLSLRLSGVLSEVAASVDPQGPGKGGRTQQVLQILTEQFQQQAGAPLLFSELSAGVGRRAAAVAFLELLQLQTWGRLKLSQQEPFGEILLTTH